MEFRRVLFRSVLQPRLACGESPLVSSALHRRVFRHWIPMSKTLIIAEKPSVALDISRALGGFAREGDYFESERYVLASSIGHLLGLVAPNDPVKGKWSFAHLPVIPPNSNSARLTSDPPSA